jgi:hypothetical protein
VFSIAVRAAQQRVGALETPATLRRRPASLWRDAWERLLRNRLAIAGLVVVILLFLLAIFGPYITPYSYREQFISKVAECRGPCNPGQLGHLLGTDQLGRDLLSRTMDGARISMSVAFVVQATVLLIGASLLVRTAHALSRTELAFAALALFVTLGLLFEGALYAASGPDADVAGTFTRAAEPGRHEAALLGRRKGHAIEAGAEILARIAHDQAEGLHRRDRRLGRGRGGHGQCEGSGGDGKLEFHHGLSPLFGWIREKA